MGKAIARQCLFCGRKGTRRFTLAVGTKSYVCESLRACDRRRRRALPPRRSASATKTTTNATASATQYAHVRVLSRDEWGFAWRD